MFPSDRKPSSRCAGFFIPSVGLTFTTSLLIHSNSWLNASSFCTDPSINDCKPRESQVTSTNMKQKNQKIWKMFRINSCTAKWSYLQLVKPPSIFYLETLKETVRTQRICHQPSTQYLSRYQFLMPKLGAQIWRIFQVQMFSQF